MDWIRTHRWTVAFILLGSVGVVWYVFHVANSVPGREDTVDQVDGPSPPPLTPKIPLERLRSKWNSEANADWPVAETLASIADTAYQTPVDADESYRNLGFEKMMPVVENSMIGYVMSSGDVTVVAFRGTNAGEISDWLANLDSLSTNTPQGSLHRGFYYAYMSLKPQIVKLLQKSKPKHLWITGHSLGGALALVCAYDLIDNEKYVIDGIITFGQPMVAHKQLADHLGTLLLGRYVHYVNESDIVPRVPPSFNHCGSLVWFTGGIIKRSKPRRMFGATATDEASTKDNKEIEPLSEQEFERLQTELRAKKNAAPDRLPDGRPLMKGSSLWIRDHSMELYLEKIRKVLGETGSR
jgi:triacylglycerol lipase